jgi:hypothetical protein
MSGLVLPPSNVGDEGLAAVAASIATTLAALGPVEAVADDARGSGLPR